MPVAPKPVPAAELDDTFHVERATMRGVTYVLRELTAEQYEECLEKARGPEGLSDNVTLLKFMLEKSLISPQMKIAEIWRLPYPIIRKLNDIINDMHFSVIETDEEKAADESDDDEGKPKA